LQKTKQSQQAFVSPIAPPAGESKQNKTEMARDMAEVRENSEKEKNVALRA
jgi:hypothetical protein